MSGARFARSGRARFFLCFLALVLMLGMVAIFHNTTRQLDKTREQQLQCETQQQTINEQLSSVIKQKFTMQKNCDSERNALMQTKHNLEEKLKKNLNQWENDKLESHVKYEKLQQQFKVLQSEHEQLMEDCSKSKQKSMEEVNSLNRKLQDILSKTQKEQNVLNSEIAMLKEKYNSEKDHIETTENRSRLLQLERIVSEYQAHCSYQPKAVSSLAHLQINKPIDIPQIAAGNSRPQTVEQKKSFSQQILPKMFKKIKQETQSSDKVASPLGAPNKLTSSEINLLNATHSSNVSAHSSTSSLPPLPMPPQQQQQQVRKLPENVAPILDNFEALLKNEDQEHAQQQEEKAESSNKQIVETQGAANVPDKAEKVAKSDDGNNNRYANVVNDLGSNVKQDNAAYINAKDFNVPVNNEEENNFFEAAESKNIANAANAGKSDGNNHAEGESLAEAGDIEVKNKNKMLDADNVNNEVAADQGKEFDDGLRLEEGMEEDADEDDDYSNLARQNGEQAIRN